MVFLDCPGVSYGVPGCPMVSCGNQMHLGNITSIHTNMTITNRVNSDFQWCCLTDQGSPSVMQHIVSAESSSLLPHSYLT